MTRPRLGPAAWALAASVAGGGAIGLLLALPEGDGGGDPALRLSEDIAATSAEAALQRPRELADWMLSGLYAAFGRTGEAAVYDALAAVATGEALESLYLARQAALLDDALDRAGQRVHEIEVTDVQVTRAGDGLAAAARWRVFGEVGHAEHLHMRGNAYAARFGLKRENGVWRVARFELLDVDRTDAGDMVASEDIRHD